MPGRRWIDAHRARIGFLIAWLAMIPLIYGVVIFSIDNERRGCERLDQVRSVEYDVLSDAIPQLVESRDAARDRGEARLARAYDIRIQDYLGYLDGLRKSTAGHLDVERGDAHIDCDAAYPYPPPISWFD